MSFFLIIATSFADQTVAVARMPLPAGKQLTFDDLSTVSLPDALVPPNAVVLGTDLVGKVLRFPVAGGAPIVAGRLVGVEAEPMASTEEEARPTATVQRSLGVVSPLAQTGDRIVWVALAPTLCVVAVAELQTVGEPAGMRVPASAVDAMADPALHWLFPGPSAPLPDVPDCAPPMQPEEVAP